jgi:murein L,D-transpeptidase YcbB/YkuD
MRRNALRSVFTIGLLAAAATAGAAPASAAADGDSISLTLNLPSYTLEVWDGSEKVKSYPVTIGMRAYQTPTGSFRISRIEWNPGWTPPDSKWARGKEPTGPGRDSPMGRVKLQFDDALYVHGPWATKQIGGAHSHGCVRLRNQDALELARLIATRQGVLSSTEITALEKNSKRTRSVRLEHSVPLRIRYDLSTEVDGETQTLKDPYHWAGGS